MLTLSTKATSGTALLHKMLDMQEVLDYTLTGLFTSWVLRHHVYAQHAFWCCYTQYASKLDGSTLGLPQSTQIRNLMLRGVAEMG